MVKNLPSNAEDAGSILVGELLMSSHIPWSEQASLCALEPIYHNSEPELTAKT